MTSTTELCLWTLHDNVQDSFQLWGVKTYTDVSTFIAEGCIAVQCMTELCESYQDVTSPSVACSSDNASALVLSVRFSSRGFLFYSTAMTVVGCCRPILHRINASSRWLFHGDIPLRAISADDPQHILAQGDK